VPLKVTMKVLAKLRAESDPYE